MVKKMTERKVVIPGEVLAKGEEYLPGENTEKRNGEIVSIRFGLAEESNNLVKVIPLSGVYHPRKGNVVIGKVENLTFNGWVIDIDTTENAFLSLAEVPRYVNKNNLKEVLDMGDMVVAKIYDSNKKSIDLTLKGRGFGKIEEGMIMKINSNKVPRIIGKEGSMINLIKDETKCNITVGQNGIVWILGDKVEDELLAKKIVLFITEKSYINGLTEEVKKWIEKERKK
ncbi:RNA-binding protein [Candidatus Pacearchaeota archaeon CG10_big_fil_rev_8_21_14_0_10_34_12]|nr:MAG: RNA-binding protein [Candidatus Pacearchaeota archaeon CG10_big_fil_rev_8_21_14_0_10_34_12]